MDKSWVASIILLSVLLSMNCPGIGATNEALWFANGQPADLMLSGVGFNNTGGSLLFNHPSSIASDGSHLLLCDRFNNRILIWNPPPDRWDDQPDIVLGQTTFTANDPGTSKGKLNFPGSVSVGNNGLVAIADTENDRILIWKQFPNQNGQSADISIFLPSFTGGSMRYEWPWGVWTDGTKLAVSATHGETLLFWNAIPVVDDQKFDYSIRLPQFGTLRQISSDGSTHFFIGDHNAKGLSQQSVTFFWNSYPSNQDQPYDFYRPEWIGGIKLTDGKLVAGGAAQVYIWDKVPTNANQQPDVIISDPVYRNGDGPSVAYAGDRLYINNYNGNHVQVYNSVPSSSGQRPDFALGSPSIDTNTLSNINYIQNPVVATDGDILLATSDFDQQLWIWKTIPGSSGLAPDVTVPLRTHKLGPWDNALYNGTLVVAGKREVGIWDSLPLQGQAPSRVLTNSIGSFTFTDLKGAALDGSFLYLADDQGKIGVWKGIPITGMENPWMVLDIGSSSLNHLNSDGEYLTAVVQFQKSAIYVFKISDIEAGGQVKPHFTLDSTQQLPLNLPTEAITFDGSLAIANMGFSQVLIWQNRSDWGDPSKAIVLGQSSLADREPHIGRAGLFQPATLAKCGNSLWVGEFKFSSRILHYSLNGSSSHPLVVSTDPANGANGVDQASKITITFNKKMDTTATASAIRISPGTISGAVWDATGTSVTLNTSLEEGVCYQVTVTRNARDTDGNFMVSDYSFTFTTKKGTDPPSVGIEPMMLIALLILLILVSAAILLLLMQKKRNRKRD